MPTLTIDLAKWVTGRLPTFEATRALGLSDQRVAQLMGVSQPTIANWARGKEPIPHVRWLALDLLVWWLINCVSPRGFQSAEDFEDSRWEKRLVAAHQAVSVWAELSRQEIKETIGEPGRLLRMHAEELMWEMVRELGARGPWIEGFERDD